MLTLNALIFHKDNDRIDRLTQEEKKLWDVGFKLLGGIDEAGRGPLAGPVAACCAVFPKDLVIEGVDDSKRLTAIKRNKMFDEIMKSALAIGVGMVDNETIDNINILNATREAMCLALSRCTPKPDFMLIDALKIDNCDIPQMVLVKGDQRSHCIAAASIIAKVTRDREMLKWHEIYPQYRFDKHKGYGTKEHIELIRKFGLSPIHRRSFCSKFICGQSNEQ